MMEVGRSPSSGLDREELLELWKEFMEPQIIQLKVRKPIVITNWFGEDSDSTTDSTLD